MSIFWIDMRSNCSKCFLLFLLVAISLVGNIDCYGQNYAKSKKAGAKYKKDFPSTFHSTKVKGKSSSHKNYITIYATSAAEAHSGNPCAQRAANRMGFQYMLHYAHCEKNHSKINNFFHNQTAYIGIFFKNGPFWKRRFRRLAAECR